MRARRLAAYSPIVHELPIIARVLDLATASAPPGTEIVRIRLRVGYLCDAEPLWLERYFRIAARGTQAESAELVVTREARPAGLEAAADAAFGYLLESIEVRDAPRRNGP